MKTDLPLARFQDLILQFASQYVPMGNDEFLRAQPFLKVTRIEKGDFLCEVGDNFSDLCFVAQGLFKTYFMTSDSTPWIRSFSCEGQHVGPYGSILYGQPSKVTVEAIEDSVVVGIRHDDMQRLYAEGAPWERLGRLLAEENYRWWEYRAYELLTLDGQGRYKSAKEALAPIIDRITQRDLAQYIGITAEALSRLKKKA